MTVLEHDPVSADGAALNHFLGLGFHALTEGEEAKLAGANTHVVHKTLHLRLGISTWRQNEDNGCFFGTALVDLLVDDWRRLYVVGAHLFHDKVLNSVDHAVIAENLDYEKLLELVELLCVVARHGNHLGRLFVVPFLPLLAVVLQGFQEAMEDFTDLVELGSVFPALIVEPF